MTFAQWFRQYGNLIPMSWPESREKQDEELAKAAWKAAIAEVEKLTGRKVNLD